MISKLWVQISQECTRNSFKYKSLVSGQVDILFSSGNIKAVLVSKELVDWFGKYLCSDGSRISQTWGTNLIWPNFPENCMKMKKIVREGAFKIILCRSATALWMNARCWSRIVYVKLWCFTQTKPWTGSLKHDEYHNQRAYSYKELILPSWT